jgi:protein-tyrosine-phosphatase
MTEVLVLCTGNASRSVMAGFMLEHLAPELTIVTAGTHTIDGQPMGMRTRNAISTIPELAGTSFTAHRSRQVYEADIVRADVVVVMEADHARYVRRIFPQAADRTGMIRRLCADLVAAPPELSVRLRALDLAEVTLSDDDDVTDPAGRDEEVYAACAAELWELCRQLVTKM